MKRTILGAVIACAVILVPGEPALAACHQFTFDKDVYTVGEGAGTVTITVSRDGSAAPSSIQYNTIDGSAKAGSDYTSTNGTLNFTNEISMSFAVPIRNDKKHEQTETFRVRLHDPSGCVPNPNYDIDQPSTVRIGDNDPKLIPSPAPTQTQSTTPTTKPTTSSPSPKRTPTKTPTSTPSTSPTPTPTASNTALAATPAASSGLSGGAVAGIVAATVVLGGIAAFFVRRRFLT